MPSRFMRARTRHVCSGKVHAEFCTTHTHGLEETSKAKPMIQQDYMPNEYAPTVELTDDRTDAQHRWVDD
jgi:hypothetical protein